MKGGKKKKLSLKCFYLSKCVPAVFPLSGGSTEALLLLFFASRIPGFWIQCYPSWGTWAEHAGCILLGCCGWAPRDRWDQQSLLFVLDAKKGKKMFFFLFVPEATPERVTWGKRKCAHGAEGCAGFRALTLWGGGDVGSGVFITPKLIYLQFLLSRLLLGNYSPAQKPWTILQICFGDLFLSLCVFLGLFSFWCGNNYIACFLCSGSD